MNNKNIERFWDKVAIDDKNKCWEWQAGTHQYGYGHFILNGKQRLAHRISWVIHFGNIPDGMFICHHCDNPPCVNPKHLFLGTNSDNQKDAHDKGLINHKGSNNPCSILVESQVKEIREKHARGARQIDLGREYGVSNKTIWNIVSKTQWTHIEELR